MSKAETEDLLKFLKPFPDEVRELALWLREFVWALYPDSNEIIYDNYNALAFGWSLTGRLGDTFCNIAVGRSTHNVHFGFYWGSKIADPEKVLQGKGNQYRYLLVKSRSEFPAKYVKKLMKNAHAYSISRLKEKKPALRGTTITKSISAAKRKPGKTERAKM